MPQTHGPAATAARGQRLAPPPVVPVHPSRDLVKVQRARSAGPDGQRRWRMGWRRTAGRARRGGQARTTVNDPRTASANDHGPDGQTISAPGVASACRAERCAHPAVPFASARPGRHAPWGCRRVLGSGGRPTSMPPRCMHAPAPRRSTGVPRCPRHREPAPPPRPRRIGSTPGPGRAAHGHTARAAPTPRQSTCRQVGHRRGRPVLISAGGESCHGQASLPGVLTIQPPRTGRLPWDLGTSTTRGGDRPATASSRRRRQPRRRPRARSEGNAEPRFSRDEPPAGCRVPTSPRWCGRSPRSGGTRCRRGP